MISACFNIHDLFFSLPGFLSFFSLPSPTSRPPAAPSLTNKPPPTGARVIRAYPRAGPTDTSPSAPFSTQIVGLPPGEKLALLRGYSTGSSGPSKINMLISAIFLKN
ncbi:hypothetical protein MLD38_030578 [Melastoma candidum]|uniref:Uncharacterized protein n=1 Tax=Melastoma candidum TaxID=119954 RepID=A0ACB9MN90_9MYRT|nr:hypothetical protein MLD38_030578 [Melastoma candidum]